MGTRKHCEILCKTGAGVHYISLLVQYTQQSEAVGDLAARCKAQLQGKVQSVSNGRVVKHKIRMVYV